MLKPSIAPVGKERHTVKVAEPRCGELYRIVCTDDIACPIEEIRRTGNDRRIKLGAQEQRDKLLLICGATILRAVEDQLVDVALLFEWPNAHWVRCGLKDNGRLGLPQIHFHFRETEPRPAPCRVQFVRAFFSEQRTTPRSSKRPAPPKMPAAQSELAKVPAQ